MGIYIVAKFGTDWSIFADACVNKVKYGKFSNSSSGPIRSIIELIQSLMVTYILAKFGIDYFNICRCLCVNKVRFSNFSKFKGK